MPEENFTPSDNFYLLESLISSLIKKEQQLLLERLKLRFKDQGFPGFNTKKTSKQD